MSLSKNVFWLIRLRMFVCDRNIKEKTGGIFEGEFVYVYGCYDMCVKKYMFKVEGI
jgi:hypothetical protein